MAAKTLIRSVEPIYLYGGDNDMEPIIIHATLNDIGITHRIVLYYQMTLILDIPVSSQWENYTPPAYYTTITRVLNTDERDSILEHIIDRKTATVELRLETYENGTLVGSDFTNVEIILQNALRPSSYGNLTVSDIRDESIAVTGSNNYIIQGESIVSITCPEAIPKTGSTIVSYNVGMGGITKSGSSRTQTLGEIRKSGKVEATGFAVCSRGFESYPLLTKWVDVIPYERISIDEYRVRRTNEVEDNIEIELEGRLSPIFVNDVKKNAISQLRYRYKKTTDSSYGAWKTTSVTSETNYTFKYENLNLEELDGEHSWNLQFEVSDRLETDIINIIVPQSTPLVSLRNKKVGINNKNPQTALDVGGSIKANGFYTQCFVRMLSSEDFNDLTEGGLYGYEINPGIYNPCTNAPGDHAFGVLEVISGGSTTIQRYTTYAGIIYQRTKYSSELGWSDWRLVYIEGADISDQLYDHIGNTSNPHQVTKNHLGLGSVNNTSDLNKPISNATQAALDTKVDKVTGKGLSTNDYTTTEKNKLAGIATGAEVNVKSDWNATSGDAQILNKPTTLSGYGITNAYTKTEVDNKLIAVYKYKGSVASYSALPTTGLTIGDVYNIETDGTNYAWTGTEWDNLGGVIPFATTSNGGLMRLEHVEKLESIAHSATKTESSSTNGNIKINNTEVTVYEHPTGLGNEHVPAGSPEDHGKFLFFNTSPLAPDTVHWQSVNIGSIPGLQSELDSKFGDGSVVMNTNPFGGKNLYINNINNALFRAESRFSVTANIYNSDDTFYQTVSDADKSYLFDGNYEKYALIPAGKYMKVNITFNPYFSTFPYGDVYISHYYTSHSQSITGRVYCNYEPHGIGWHELDFSDFISSGTYLIKKAHNEFHQISEMEFTITARANGHALVSQIEFALRRPSTAEMPFVDKYRENKLYSDLNMNGNRLLNVGTPTSEGDAVNKAYVDGELDDYAPKASPTFTGIPKAPTAPAGTNTTQIATTAFVKNAVGNAGGEEASFADYTQSDDIDLTLNNAHVHLTSNATLNIIGVPTAKERVLSITTATLTTFTITNSSGVTISGDGWSSGGHNSNKVSIIRFTPCGNFIYAHKQELDR